MRIIQMTPSIEPVCLECATERGMETVTVEQTDATELQCIDCGCSAFE